jgi:L-malate glycosyltransferase
VRVFVIPTWHPTPTRPSWCNWILPHVAMLREEGIDVYILQLGLDDEPIPEGTDPWQQPIRLLGEHHLYVPVPRPTRRYQCSRFCYGAFLRRYINRLRDVYRIAVDQWGRPEIMHAHGSLPSGYAAACLGGESAIPVIVQEHYTGFESDARFPWRTGCYVEEMGRWIQGFYAVSPGYAQRIERTGLINVTGVLPNPIDTDLFVAAPRVQQDHALQIVTAGNMDLRKGTDILFQSLHRIMPTLDWRLTIFGDTSQRGLFSRWLDDPHFSRRVSLPGRVSQRELQKAYSQSDLYVVSSRIETANVSMLEAMACGVPVVTTSCGAPETLIDETVGIAVKANDPAALAEGIMQAARNAARYDRKVLRRFVVDRYSKPVVAEMVVNAYQESLRGRETKAIDG